ncbi:MAG: hydantoinase B/oxoprolinase family protein [Cyanobacteria bacterium J06649_4]
MTSSDAQASSIADGIGDRWQFWIDRGGTFTDIVAQRPDGSTCMHKLLSENPDRYVDAPIQGIRELMGVEDGAPIPAAEIAVVKMGTTVATNALLERKGDRTLFITTQGFKDGLRIGYQNRPDIFARQIVLPEMLYEQVVEVNERVAADGAVVQSIHSDEARRLNSKLQAAYEKGIRACAISFIHGYRYPAHEQQVAAIARKVGFTQISVSHEVSPLIKWVSRSDTTVVDAYLSPILRRYVDRIEKALTAPSGYCPQILFMQSNGGLTPARYFQGKDSILSGPAGGIVGAVATSLQAGFNKIITFDMGGTSTDVAHVKNESDRDNGYDVYERAFETEVAGVRLRSPMMAIHTVAAGGGSVLSFRDNRYQVGPESAGAHPGPACYRNNGPLTVTDCNVMVGKIQPQFFPQVFGQDGEQPLDSAIVKEKFSELAGDISAATGDTRSPEEVAEGFLSIAIDNMANAIKKISVQKGYDLSDYKLCCFGAAGGQHACRLAESLGMETVIIDSYAGVLSAYGMGLADRRVLKEKSMEAELTDAVMPFLTAQVDKLSQAAIDELKASGAADIRVFDAAQQLHIRYAGTDSALGVDFGTLENMRAQFTQRYQQQYGITLPDKPLMVATMAVEAIGKTSAPAKKTYPYFPKGSALKAVSTVSLFSENQWHQAPIFKREDIAFGDLLQGPAIIAEQTGTIVVEPGWSASINDSGSILLSLCRPEDNRLVENVVSKQRQPENQEDLYTLPEKLKGKPDPVRLEIFNNLFQAIAEQMGFTLQNTSSSVNIKERLDFSCAIFDAHGQLVSNAPHIPVHLGSMGESVQALSSSISAPFQPGDVYISNNPYNGGTHLPDITAISPVFIGDESTAPLFFVASRGHHADIGGIAPGSMPPNSTHLEQEGILFDNFLLVQNGCLKEKALFSHLTNAAHPARNPRQNLADLQAQVAANSKGAQELNRMVRQFGLGTTCAYMQHVQDNAEQAVRRVITNLYEQHGAGPLSYQLPMDCGGQINVSITLNATEQTALIDFSRTSSQQSNNFNAPLAVCKAAVLYAFRTLVDTPIPLNAGCLKPLEIVVPEGSMLNPVYPAAVVAGNVETSQAITDALYGALGVMAASQGTMNNFTFGCDRYQYYETICGGSGAGPTFHGTDAVQTHMTNSRLTDPEVLELRFPVLLKAFSIRARSGGAGQYRGGDGVVRQLLFRENMTANLLSGRRKTQPFGIAGGKAGQPGRSRIIRKDGSEDALPATAAVDVRPGDEIIIETPGGGGYGRL